jgi:WD40 repeat protein/serine/threonine protein kinase/tetratricopeptide (TPR) repeat protein
MSTTNGSRNPVEALAEEFLERKRRGEPASPEEYAERYPDLAEEILALFPALLVMEDLGGDSVERTGSIGAGSAAGRISGVATGRIGEFRLLREVGRGGMGIVYEAEQESLGRRVALKLLPAGALGDARQVRRFEREARAAARLHHTNIVPVFGVGQHEGTHYYVMQFIQSQGLDAVLDELKKLRHDRTAKLAGTALAPVAAGRREAADIAASLVTGRYSETPKAEQSPDRSPTLAFTLAPSIAPKLGSMLSGSAFSSATGSSSGSGFSETDRQFALGVARIGVQVAEALAYAHRQGILHRDIKPSNLLLDKDGHVWVADFGLAKATSGDDLTHTGDIVGTLRYMAPERFRGEGDARADVYALGLTLYEMLALRPAFDDPDRASLVHKVTQELPPRLRKLNRRVPWDLETIIHKAIEREPKERYGSAAELGEDLQRFLDGEPIVARPVPLWERAWKWAKRRPAAAALVVVLQAAAASLLVMGVISYIQIHAALALATDEKIRALSARNEESAARNRADEARRKADEAKNTALAETYRASLGEVRALRAGHLPGWRDRALRSLARLATLPTPRRDLTELRTEAVAALGGFDFVEVAQFAGMSDAGHCVDFSPDSRILAIGAVDGRLYLWENTGGPSRWSIVDPVASRGPAGAVVAAIARPRFKFLPDATLAYTAPDGRISFLDASGRPSGRRPLSSGLARAWRLTADKRGRWIAVDWSRGRVDLYDLANGSLRRSFEGDPYSFALSPDGKRLAMVRRGASVDLYQTDGDAPPNTVARIRSDAFGLTFSPDGSLLGASLGDLQAAIIWDVSGLKEPLTLRGHKEKVHTVDFSPDGEWVATSSDDHTTRIWDVRTGQLIASLQGPWFVEAAAFSPDGQYLAACYRTYNKQANLYQIRGRREHRRLVGHRYGTQCLAFNPRESTLATGADDCDFIIWNADTCQPRHRWHTAESYVSALAYSPDGTLLASSNGTMWDDSLPDYPVVLWDAQTYKQQQLLHGQRKGVASVAFDASGRRVASVAEDGTLIVWDASSGGVVRRELIGPPLGIKVAFVEDGRRVAASVNGLVALVDLDGKEPTRRVSLPHGGGSFVIDARRKRLVVGTGDGELIALSLPDLSGGRRLPKAHNGSIWSLALSPDGRVLATGGDDRKIVLRDPETFEPYFTFPEWTGVVKNLAFDRLGSTLAVVGVDSDVAVWDLKRIHDGLTDLGLAWDQPPPDASPDSIDSEAKPAEPDVAVIQPDSVESVALELANGLIRSGSQSFAVGKVADAMRDLNEACRRLRALRERNPGADRVASRLGVGLLSYGAILRAAGRVADARSAIEEACQALEGLRSPASMDQYNLACSYARLSALPGSGEPPSSSTGGEKLALRAMDLLRWALAAGMADYALMDRDHDLDPLRNRPDFRDLMLDRGFPSDPFVLATVAATQPSPADRERIDQAAAPALAGYVGIGTTGDTTADGLRVSEFAPGGPAAKDGRLQPGDTILGIAQEVLFAGKSLVDATAYLRGDEGTKIRVIVRPQGTNRREVYELTRAFIPAAPLSPIDALDRALAADPGNFVLRFQRGDLLARSGAWRAALGDYRAALECDPSDTAKWMDAAVLAIQVGDLEGYRRLARAMLDRFEGGDEITAAERTAKIGLVIPPPDADRPRLTALTDRAVTEGANSPLVTWFQLARGMAAFRDSQFRTAVSWLQKVEDSTRSTAECKLTALFFLAMVDARQGNLARARSLLEVGHRTLNSIGRAAAYHGASWHDWLICQFALAEAQATILYDPGFPPDPFAR